MRIQKKKLRREIATRMRIRGKGSLETESDAKIQKKFHPHSAKGPKAGYPLYQISHEYAKIPTETVANFVSIKRLMTTLRQNQAIEGLLTANPKLEASFILVLKLTVVLKILSAK